MRIEFEWNGDSYVAKIGDGNLYRVRAEQDSDAESPREWSNACVMVCEHRRYNLGDYRDGADSAIAAVRASRFYRDTWEDSESGEFVHKGERRDCFDFSEAGDVWAAMLLCDDIETMPLYLYDHSGITISTGRFSCPWDSGQVGFAFVDRRKLEEMTGAKRWSPARREWAREAIELETRVYDSYITGRVFGYICERATEWDSDGDATEWEEFAACWGFYGEPDDGQNGMAEQAGPEVESDMRQRGPVLDEKRRDAIEMIRALVVDRQAAATPAGRATLQEAIAEQAREARLANIERRQLAKLEGESV